MRLRYYDTKPANIYKFYMQYLQIRNIMELLLHVQFPFIRSHAFQTEITSKIKLQYNMQEDVVIYFIRISSISLMAFSTLSSLNCDQINIFRVISSSCLKIFRFTLRNEIYFPVRINTAESLGVDEKAVNHLFSR